MKKNLFCIWLVFAILFSVNTQAQMTIGGKKEPEAFSVLELLNKGGLRLPQMTTAERDAFAVKNNDKGNGLTIYNKTTNCVEYWNAKRWVSLCDGTSQATISPEPCVNVAADGTGCDSTFKITDPDCPNGPFNISIVAGSEYASLYNVDNANGSFKVYFNPNETVNIHTVLVRVTSTCTSLFKEFLFSQNGVDCSSMSYAVPAMTASATTLCTGGSVYLSVPANTANLDKLIWTRNGVPVARGVNYYVATLTGRYNVSMGAVGCNTNAGNEKNITDSGSTAPSNISILASNNGVICGSNSVTLSASGATGSVAWFHNGVEEKSGISVDISGDSSVGEWFAAVKSGSCYSKQSNIITVTKSTAGGQIIIADADVLVNGKPLNTFTAFCSGGSLDLSIANKQNGINYTWYNGNDPITVNPFVVPTSQTTMSLRMVATDNSGAKCPAEAHVLEKNITSGNTPGQPNITGNTVLCDGSTDLTVVPAVAGTYTYTWYKDNVKMSETAQTITVSEGGVYNATVTNTTRCVSTLAIKTVSSTISSLPEVSWVVNPATATFGAKVTLQASGTFNPTSYTWTADNGATITGSGASVSVQLPASGADGLKVKITVIAKNDCGNSVVKEHEITLNAACPTPIVSAQSNTAQNTTAGSSVTLSVSVTAATAVQQTYKWYKTTTATNSGGTEIPNATSASYSYKPSAAGTSYFYCEVKNGCTGTPAGYSPAFTVVAADDPGTLTDGEGTLSGKTCFDIALSNDNTQSCGTLSSRSANRSDFTIPGIYNQTYTFTPKPSAAVSNVRFVFVESLSGQIIESYSGGNSGTNIMAPVEFKVKYYSSLNTTALGKATPDALSVTIYAVYNNKGDGSGKDVKTQLTAKIKDCACCGAMISATEWKEFMCYNLGVSDADQAAYSPFNDQVTNIYGRYYQWGTKNSYVMNLNNGVPVYNPTASGWITPPTKTQAQGWSITGAKSATDPCPDGYRVPTMVQWQGVLNNNTIKAVGTFGSYDKKGAVFFGETLMLPLASYIYAGNYYGGAVMGSYFMYAAADINPSSRQAITMTETSRSMPSSINGIGFYTVPQDAATVVRCISEK